VRQIAVHPRVRGSNIFVTHGKLTRHRGYRDTAEELYGRLPVSTWLMRGLAHRFESRIRRGWVVA